MTQRTAPRETPPPLFSIVVRGYDGRESVWRCTIPKHIAADAQPPKLSEAFRDLGPGWVEELRIYLDSKERKA